MKCLQKELARRGPKKAPYHLLPEGRSAKSPACSEIRLPNLFRQVHQVLKQRYATGGRSPQRHSQLGQRSPSVQVPDSGVASYDVPPIYESLPAMSTSQPALKGQIPKCRQATTPIFAVSVDTVNISLPHRGATAPWQLNGCGAICHPQCGGVLREFRPPTCTPPQGQLLWNGLMIESP